MNVLILSVNFSPQQFGISRFATESAEKLADLGHSVKVITARSFDQRFRKMTDVLQINSTRNLEIIRVPVYLFRHPTFINRVLFDSSFFVSAFIRSFRNVKAIDTIIIISPPLQLGIIGLFLHFAFGKKYIFYVQDIVPDLPEKLALISNKPFLTILRGLEKSIYDHAYRVITISKGMQSNIGNKCKKGVEKVFVVPNWIKQSYDGQKNSLRFKSRKSSREGFSKDKKLFLYAGSFGRKQNFPDALPLIEMVGKVCPRIHFVFVGDGAYKKDFQTKLSESGCKNFTFFDSLPQEKFEMWQDRSDVSFITQDWNLKDELLPSKLMGTMSLGKPVLCVANRDSEMARIVREARCGIVLDLKIDSILNESEIKKSLRAFFDLKQVRYFSRNGKNYATREFDRDMALRTFASVITS